MRVLLTGASGFVGSHLLTALREVGHKVTPLIRRPSKDLHGAADGDLLSVDMRGLVSASDVVIHAASKTSGLPDELWQGNVLPARRVARMVSALGTPLLYVSSTGVYGRSYGHFDDPREIPRRPTSPLSRARAAAEDVLLAEGATVIRPHVVYGPGDRWVVPPLATFMLREDAWLGAADVAVAAISARRLAQGIVALLDRPSPNSIFHAAEAEPVPVAKLVRPLFQAAGRPLPSQCIPIDEAHRKLGPLGVSRNALQMLGRSSSMDTKPFWGVERPERNP
jgi:2-alkyl-3-oxoalkanoate reductase